MAKKLYVVFFILLFLSVFLLVSTVSGAYQLEYRIEVHIDGSAKWIIEHRFLEGQDEAIFKQLSDPTYFGDYFIENVTALMNAVKLKTGRENMTVENFKMTVNVFDSYRVVKYEFDWIEFAEEKGKRIVIGDVFEVDGLFLYGNGALNMIFPMGYVVERVSPKPNVESDQILTWYEVKNFGTGEPRVVLSEKTLNIVDLLKSNVPLIVALIAFAGIGSASLWFFKFRKKEKKEAVVTFPHIPPVTLGIEDDEEKVVALLKSAGGRLYQSTLVEQCEFSRSKISKLLTSMEMKGRIRRQKKGREKVVTLIDELTEVKDTRNKGMASH